MVISRSLFEGSPAHDRRYPPFGALADPKRLTPSASRSSGRSMCIGAAALTWAETLYWHDLGAGPKGPPDGPETTPSERIRTSRSFASASTAPKADPSDALTTMCHGGGAVGAQEVGSPQLRLPRLAFPMEICTIGPSTLRNRIA